MLYFDFVEVCGGSSVLSRAADDLGLVVAPVLDLTYSSAYDFGDLQFFEWVLYMVSAGRFRSFFVEPPCTTFSPAAYPSVRSYENPVGYDRLCPKTYVGNLLAFRSLLLLRYGCRHKTFWSLQYWGVMVDDLLAF